METSFRKKEWNFSINEHPGFKNNPELPPSIT
jgi:hypothetical protein